MTIAKVLAVYKTTPIVLVVEPAEGPVCELSLTDLRGAGHRLSDGARGESVTRLSRRICVPAALSTGLDS